jgi:hypothetical protein
MVEEDKETKNLLAKSEISLLLDTYDDIFSDFEIVFLLRTSPKTIFANSLCW